MSTRYQVSSFWKYTIAESRRHSIDIFKSSKFKVDSLKIRAGKTYIFRPPDVSGEGLIYPWTFFSFLFFILSINTPSVRFVGGGRPGGGFKVFKPRLVDDETPTGDCKVWSGVGFDPIRKVRNPNSSFNPYELMSDIIHTISKNFL